MSIFDKRYQWVLDLDDLPTWQQSLLCVVGNISPLILFIMVYELWSYLK
jgi:hypothetical protein